MVSHSRREVLRGVGGGAITLSASLGPASWNGLVDSTASGPLATEEPCTPGHTEGDPACDQIRHDDESRIWLESADTGMLTTFTYPCGWTTTTNEFDDRVQTNVNRSGIGEADAYVDVQVRNYLEPVSEGFLEEVKAEGDYQEIAYEYAGEQRTGLLSSIDTAQYGTTAHAVVPGRRKGEEATFRTDALYHVEVISTLKGADCDSPPDYRVVESTLRSIGPNTPASVTISDQVAPGMAVVIDSARLFRGGYMVVYETAGLDAGKPVESILGASTYLIPGQTTDLVVGLDSPITETTEVTARVHVDTDNDQLFDYVTEQNEDGPVFYRGSVVEDTATIQRPKTRTQTTTHRATPTLPETSTPTDTATSPPTPTETSPPRNPTESGEDGPGFGVATAVTTFGLATLLFVRNLLQDQDE